MIEIIGAPFDLCGMRLGSRLGPSALRLAGLREALSGLDYLVRDLGDVSACLEASERVGLRNFEPLMECVRTLQATTSEILDRGHVPLMLGGEHTLSVATISAALQHYQGDLTVIWIDAHADINTPSMSETGNIHGMPLAALAGEPSGTVGACNDDWNELLATLGTWRLDIRNVAWYGLRDVDKAEREKLVGLPVTMHAIDRHGIQETVQRIDHFLRKSGQKNLWISFDVDALDPILAPGTGTAVRGGLSYREAHLLAELLYEQMETPGCPYRLAGVDLVETNPIHDTHNQTATVGVEWVASLFGKTIVGKR